MSTQIKPEPTLNHCDRCSRELLNLMPSSLCIECKRIVWEEKHLRAQ